MSAIRHAVCPHPRIRPGLRARHATAAVLAYCALLLAACSPPEPPEKERPPEPQASAPDRHTELRDAIQAPQDKARAVEGAVGAAAQAQRSTIKSAGR